MANPPRRPATMRDVAERAGVSRSLVSTVFRDVPGASPSTRARVLEAASDLGYRPDERARQLRSHQNTLIGVTLTATQPFHVALVELLHDAVDLGGYELSITFSTDTPHPRARHRRPARAALRRHGAHRPEGAGRGDRRPGRVRR